MGLVNSAGRALLSVMPRDNDLLYRLGRALVDRHNNDNNCDIGTNGETRFLERELPAARVVFDVGANLGKWTETALSINPRAHYHCFEPSPATFRALSARSLPSNVILNNIGLGDVCEERDLHCFGDGRSVNSLYKREGTASTQEYAEAVTIDTLDAYCERSCIDRVDLVKIDVEGHELAALKGGRRMLAEGRIETVQFEYGGTYIDARVLLKDIWEYVLDTNPGYAFFKVHPRELRYVPAYKQTMETYKYSNWVIRRRDEEACGACMLNTESSSAPLKTGH